MASEDDNRGSGFASVANHATIIVAIIGATAACLGNLYTAHENLAVSQQDQQAKLIFKAIEGSDLQERAKNLHFLIETGLLSDPDGKFKSIKEDKFPSKISASFDCSKDSADVAQFICHSEELAILDKLMGKEYFKLLGILQGDEKRKLVTDQVQWLAERNSCLPLGASASGCMSEKYELRVGYLASLLNERGAGATHVVASTPTTP
jgi:uncharacterized protein YecT (DUF1311 family)